MPAQGMSRYVLVLLLFLASGSSSFGQAQGRRDKTAPRSTPTQAGSTKASPFELSTIEAQAKAGSLIVVHETAHVIYGVNPIIVFEILKTGASIAGDLKRKDKVEDLEEDLKLISRQLEIVNHKLDLVLNGLSEIKHKIDSRSDQDARNRVKAVTRTILLDYEGWRRYYPREHDVIVSRVSVLHDATEDVALRDTFANYMQVAESMLLEHKLFGLLQREQEFRRPRFQRFAEYFRKAQNPAEPGSIRQVRDAVAAEIALTEANHVPLAGREFACIFGNPTSYYKYCVDGQRCNFRKTRITAGNLQTGYYETGAEGFWNYGCFATCATHDHDRDHGSVGRNLLMLSSPNWDKVDIEQFSYEATVSGYAHGCTSREANREPPYLNEERAQYINNKGYLKVLDAALQTAAQFQAEAERLSSAAGSVAVK